MLYGLERLVALPYLSEEMVSISAYLSDSN